MPIALEEVGNDNSHTSANACHAVDKDVGLLSSLFYEVVGLLKVARNVVLLVILSRDVKIMRDIFPPVDHETTPGNGQDCPDAFACIT
jgi:spore maturation protein SpmA